MDGSQFTWDPVLGYLHTSSRHIGPVELKGNGSQPGHGKLQGCKEQKHLHRSHIAEQTSNSIWNNQPGKLGQSQGRWERRTKTHLSYSMGSGLWLFVTDLLSAAEAGARTSTSSSLSEPGSSKGCFSSFTSPFSTFPHTLVTASSALP